MATLKIPDITPQSAPLLEDRGDPALPGLMSRVYWLFLSGIQVVLGLMAAAIDTLQTTTVAGQSTLTHVNRVTKVTAAGIVGESSITDDGTTVTVPENVAVDTGTGGYVRLVLGDASHAGYIDWFDKNRVRIGYMGYVDGALYITLENSNNVRIAAGKLGIKKAPTYDVDALGDINAGGVFRVGNTQVVGARGAALTATAAAGNAAGIAYLQADAATWVTLMNNLRTRVSELESRLQAHGLIS